MFDKRLFQLAPGLEKLIAGKVALMWVGLLANIGFMLSLVMLLNSLLTAVAPPLLQCGGTSQGAACPVPLSDRHGADVLPMAGDVMIYVLLALVCIAVRYTATTHATRLGTEAAELLPLTRAAHHKDMAVVVLTGRDGGALADELAETDVLIAVPHERAVRIREGHALALHCLCDAVDLQLMGEQDTTHS